MVAVKFTSLTLNVFFFLLRDLQKHRMGIFVINVEDGEIGHFDDSIISIEVLIFLACGSVARAYAMMLGVIYALNTAYPKEQWHYYKFIQKVLFRMDSEQGFLPNPWIKERYTVYPGL